MTIDECIPGTNVMWHHVPRGGYGFVIPIPALVVSVGKRRVCVAVTNRAGNTMVQRHVEPASLHAIVPAQAQVADLEAVRNARVREIRLHIDNVRTLLGGYTFVSANEAALQRSVHDVLAKSADRTMLDPAREIPSGGGKYDITLVERPPAPSMTPFQIVLELKVKGSAPAVERQAQRYAKQPGVDAVVVVSTSQVLLSKLVPGTIGGKPFDLISLRTAI